MSDTTSSADHPLRADATDEQINNRGDWLLGELAVNGVYRSAFRRGSVSPAVIIAREFATACVAAERGRHLPPDYGRCGRCGSEWVTATQHGLFFSHTCPRPTP